MEHGNLIARLRKERGFSQEKLSKLICNRSTLAAFEQNNSRLSMDLFMELLNKLNLGLDEYMYIFNSNNHLDKHVYSENFIINNKKIFNWEFPNSLLIKFNETNDYFYYGLYAQYMLINYHIKGNEIDMTLIDKITENLKSYLNKVETWGRFEFVLYYNCLFVFNDHFIATSFKKNVKNMSIFNDHAYYSSDIIRFLINAVQLFFERKNEENFKFFLTELELYSNKFAYLEGKIIVDVFNYSLSKKSDKILLKHLEFMLERYEMNDWKKYL